MFPRFEAYLHSILHISFDHQSNSVFFIFQANEFIDKTGIDALAVCIGNVHGKYPASGPKLRLDLLKVKHRWFPFLFHLSNSVHHHHGILIFLLFASISAPVFCPGTLWAEFKKRSFSGAPWSFWFAEGTHWGNLKLKDIWLNQCLPVCLSVCCWWILLTNDRHSQECIKLGVRKFNVNTEVRKAYMESLSSSKKDLILVMSSAKEAMKAVVAEKMLLFGSAGKAWWQLSHNTTLKEGGG